MAAIDEIGRERDKLSHVSERVQQRVMQRCDALCSVELDRSILAAANAAASPPAYLTPH